MWEVLDRLRSKAVAARVENLGIDTGTPTGKLMLNILGGVTEFEREMMLERQREGVSKAKAEGKPREKAYRQPETNLVQPVLPGWTTTFASRR